MTFPTFVNDVDKANDFLAGAVFNCIYRINGVCWENCQARAYCDPKAMGLRDVAQLKVRALP